MKIPEEVLRKMKNDHYCASNQGQSGWQAAADAVVHYVLAEALKPPSSSEFQELARGYSTGHAQRVMRDFCNNRFAALTAKPDPAVEAVAGILRTLDQANTLYSYPVEAAAIVAAVDKARKEGDTNG